MIELLIAAPTITTDSTRNAYSVCALKPGMLIEILDLELNGKYYIILNNYFLKAKWLPVNIDLQKIEINIWHSDINISTAKNKNVIWADENRLNNVLLPTLFNAVNNIVRYCKPTVLCNNAEQCFWQYWTMWAAKHCSSLFSSGQNRCSFFAVCSE